MKTKYDKTMLENLVKNSTSISDLLKRLNLKPSGGSHRYISKLLRYFNIDTNHFTGKTWNKGKTRLNDNRIANQSIKQRIYSTREILSENSPTMNNRVIKRTMIENGIEYICSNGHQAEWMGNPLTLHVDHINGINNDNRLENLRFLCPNCHQQTPTWGNKKR